MKIVTLLSTLAVAAFSPLVSAGGDCGTTMFDKIDGSSTFDILDFALEVTGLDDVLDGGDEHDPVGTLFAPTDEAFRRLFKDLGVDDYKKFVKDNKAAVKDILLYHVVLDNVVFAEDLEDGQEIKTAVGRKVEVEKDNGEVFINEAKVTDADIDVCNGVIHKINKVLIPKIKMSDCKSSNDCGFCEGDCDNDHDCDDDRVCVRRTEKKTPVPFCKGGENDSSTKDYCTHKIKDC